MECGENRRFGIFLVFLSTEKRRKIPKRRFSPHSKLASLLPEPVIQPAIGKFLNVGRECVSLAMVDQPHFLARSQQLVMWQLQCAQPGDRLEHTVHRVVALVRRRAVRRDATKIDRSCTHSPSRDSILAPRTMSISESASSQKRDSSPSSMTVPIFEMNSARDRARQAARWFAATDIPDRSNCRPISFASSVAGNVFTNLMMS